jgi:peptide/nickel transport system permease protein
VLAYIARRLGALVVILFGSSFILYNLAAISADPLEGLRQSTEPNAKALMEALSRDLRLDLPPPLRYFLWLRGVLGVFTGNFSLGETRDYQDVMSELSVAIPVTIRLVFAATIIAIILGVAMGIVSALRQYSRFDYSMTFVAFLMFSLPIFWVAVLLKQYMAIEFNNFLSEPNISPGWLLGMSAVSGIFWAGIISGSRKQVVLIFLGVGAATAAFITGLDALNWFIEPKLGIFGMAVFAVASSYGITQLSTGISNKEALRSALAIALGIGVVGYYPLQWVFDFGNKKLMFLGIIVAIPLLAQVISRIFSRVDRGPVARTATITGFLVVILMIFDKLMRSWLPYMETDAVNFRPIPTIGQSKAELTLYGDVDWWVSTLDVMVHLILPTVALTLISFAGYIRYSRGTLLEVLNQDYIRTARAKGLTERTVIMRHAFRNTMIPLTTIMVADFAGIIGGAIITERVFGWTGMGTLFNKAITGFDLNLLMGVFLVTGTLAVLANLVADLLYSALDPRIRVGSGK